MKYIKSLFLVALICTVCYNNVAAQTLSNIAALKFSSTTQYDQVVGTKTIAALQNVTGFSTYASYQSLKPAAGSPDPNDDAATENDGYDVANDEPTFDKNDYWEFPMLSYILNTDRVVVVGNWIIKVDLPNDRVLVLNTSNISSYNDLLNDNTSNQNIISLSTEDEVIEIINQLNNGASLEEARLWCKDKSADWDKDPQFFYNGNRKRLDAKVVYQKGGILFSLEGKGKTQKRFLRIWWHDGQGHCSMSRIELDYEVRCKQSGFSHWGDPSGLTGYSAGSTCHYQPYFSTRGLKSYRYHIDFTSTHGNGHVGIEK